MRSTAEAGRPDRQRHAQESALSGITQQAAYLSGDWMPEASPTCSTRLKCGARGELRYVGNQPNRMRSTCEQRRGGRCAIRHVQVHCHR